MRSPGARGKWSCGAILLVTLAVAPCAHAHRDDYLDETIVYLTLEESEVETEYWFDYGRDRGEDTNFSRHHAAVEWGILERWMVDGRATLRTDGSDRTAFDGGRVETRYRFGDEGEHFVDIALSAEMNWERDEQDRLVAGVEPRLILSKDLHEKLNLTLNLSEELPLNSDVAAFLIAAGVRYNWTQLVRCGVEWHHDTESGGGSIIPQVWFAFRSGLTVKLGYSAGYAANQEDYGRVAFEYEF